MKRVIVESPYAADNPAIVERNIEYARAAVRDSVLRKEACIASHLLFTQVGILHDAVPEERALGIAAGLAWLPVAELMALYADYGISAGMQAAAKQAAHIGVPVEIRKILPLETGQAALDGRRSAA